MALLVRNAIQIFRSSIVTKNQLAGRFKSSAPRISIGRRTKRSERGPHSTQGEKFANAALVALLDGGTLNINCIMSQERAHLMWQLYRQLRSLMPPEHPLGPNPFMMGMQPHGLPLLMPSGPIPGGMQMLPPSPHQFMHPAQHQVYMGVPHFLDGQAHAHVSSVPAPHQFLMRESHKERASHYDSPYQEMAEAVPAGGILHMPRSGQSMKLNFHHSDFGHGASSMGPPPQRQPRPNSVAHASTATAPPLYGVSPGSHITVVSDSGALGKGSSAGRKGVTVGD